VFMVWLSVFFQSSTFPVIILVLCAHSLFWHVWTISVYFPQFGSAHPPSWAVLWCVHFRFCLGLSHYCPQAFHLKCFLFCFSVSACPWLHSI
jgi:hypothetical protein